MGCSVGTFFSWGSFELSMLVTFLIPTVGRETLQRTLASLHAQTDDDWVAIVVYDNIVPDRAATARIRTLRTPAKLGVGRNGAGAVRNVGMAHVTTPWVAFVDDDDTLSPTYVAALRQNISRHPQLPAMIFRMVHHGGNVLPPAEHSMFQPCAVGISFAVHMDLWRAHQLAFVPSAMEDYALLCSIHALTDMLLAPQVTYFVRNQRARQDVTYPERVIARSLPSGSA
jgi:glycosyltransferase involved in cell wall biosynthesis